MGSERLLPRNRARISGRSGGLVATLAARFTVSSVASATSHRNLASGSLRCRLNCNIHRPDHRPTVIGKDERARRVAIRSGLVLQL